MQAYATPDLWRHREQVAGITAVSMNRQGHRLRPHRRVLNHAVGAAAAVLGADVAVTVEDVEIQITVAGIGCDRNGVGDPLFQYHGVEVDLALVDGVQLGSGGGMLMVSASGTAVVI